MPFIGVILPKLNLILRESVMGILVYNLLQRESLKSFCSKASSKYAYFLMEPAFSICIGMNVFLVN